MRKAIAVVLLSCLGAPSFAADDLARLVELMAKVGFATSPSFSPDGRTLAFVSNVSGLPQVWTVPVAGGYPELVTAFDDPVGSVRWSPDGQWLAFSLAPGGGMNAQVYVVKPNGTGVRMLTAGGKSNHFMGNWSRDGRAITLSSNRRTPEAMDVYYVDPEGKHRLVAENRGMVMAGLADYPREIAAGANLFGVVNFETFFKQTEPWMAAISTVEYGDPKTQAAMLRELSPLHRADRVVAPTLVLHGANDTNVTVVEAEQVVASLKKRGVPVKYVLFADEGHGWRKTRNRITSTVEIVAWFAKYLAGAPPATL